MRNILLYSLLALFAVVAACTTQFEPDDSTKAEPEAEVFNVADATGIKQLPDGTKYIIHPDKITSGGPPMDGIPSIDNPNLGSLTQRAEIEEKEIVGNSFLRT